jgi:hypothetical protein
MTNSFRAQIGQRLIESFNRDGNGTDSDDTDCIDIIASILHFAFANDLEPAVISRLAYAHFAAEIEDEQSGITELKGEEE